MSTKIFDTHNNSLIADRVVTNLRSLGFEWRTENGPVSMHRYLFASEETTDRKVITHSDDNREGELPCYDCAWMAEDEVPTLTTATALEEMQQRELELMRERWAEARQAWTTMQPTFGTTGGRL